MEYKTNIPKPTKFRAARTLCTFEKSSTELCASASNLAHPTASKQIPQKLGAQLRRRSKSVSDMTKLPAMSAFKAGLKRLAETSSNPAVKEKIAKPGVVKKVPESKPKPKAGNPSKPAPYDYKARYNLLVVKHTELRKKNSEDDQKFKEATSECEELRVQVEKLIDIEKRYHEVRIENEKNKSIIRDLTSKLNDAEVELGETKQQKFELIAKLTSTEAEYKTSSYELEKSTMEVNHANGTITELRSSIEMYRKGAESHEQLRRHLHNKIQDLLGNIRVFCRVRPPLSAENDRSLCNIAFLDEATLEIKQVKESNQFNFDKVFAHDSSQEDVFEELAHVVQSALDGYHVCVFAYGQTGSGKTFTMQGGRTEDELGMIPRTINLLFKSIQTMKLAGWSYKIETSFMEIYNEHINDLLSPDRKQHEIRFNEGKGITVSNLKVVPVSTSGEFLREMETAHTNRAVASTNYNEHSSRSHALTKIFIRGTNEISNATYIGSLNLVDLAGSESAKTSSVERINETKSINKSLSALGNVMMALHNKSSHVPYRDSKLTYVLQSCLGGNSKTLMFVNISPLEECYKESINSLRFAAKVKEVKINVKKNKVCKAISSVQV